MTSETSAIVSLITGHCSHINTLTHSFFTFHYVYYMKKLIVFIVASLTSLTMTAQMVTTEGTDFWLAVEPNWSNTDVDQYTFAAGGKRNCTVTITNPNSGWSYTMNVTANQVTKYQLPTSNNSQVWQSGSCTVLNTGLHITSTDTIQFYFFNHSGSPHASDASTIFPTEALGVDYIVQSYPVDNSTYNSFSYFSILATEDGTTVDITFAGNTNTTIHTGDHVTVTLNAGQVYQVLSTEYTGDLSGTIIHSDDCHPIAVFSGITLGRVPTNGQSSDHLFQQCFPISTWANDWILTPSVHHNIDYVRVTAASDNCQIFLNGSTTPAATIQTAQTHEFSITSATRVHTSEPASLFQYLDSRHNTWEGGDHGDASSFAPTPLDMTTRYAAFPTFHVESRSPSTNEYYANVIVPTAETSLLRYNGSPISASFSPISGTTYSHVRFAIAETGQHLLTTTGSGFIGHTYGVGEDWDSYAYSLGGTSPRVVPLADADTSTIDSVDIAFCGNVFHFFTYTFTASVDTLVTIGCSLKHLHLTIAPQPVFRIDTTLCAQSFTWHGHTYAASGHYRDTVPATDGGCDTIYDLYLLLGDVYEIATDTAVCAETVLWRGHTLDRSGTYSDTIVSAEGCDTVHTLNLTVNPTYHFTIDTTTCQSPLRWGDTALTQAGTHTLHYLTPAGCDSIYTIHLTLLPTYDTAYDTTACSGTTLIINGTPYTVPDTATIHYTAANGCDSTIHINILAFPQYDTTYYVSIPDTESYEWIDGQSYTVSTNTLITFTDRNGCDSIIRLVLEVRQIPRPPLIWVPNIFIPTASENNRFQVFSQYVDKMTVTIFHRWGEEVCTFDGLTETWDGTRKGIPCPEGAYVYLIKYHATEIDDYAINHPIVGTVLLIR